MLVLLLAGFGGALALKALEERQTSENATLVQQARESEALAGHIRAELVSARSRMEGLLLSGASLEAIRRGAPFDAVVERSPENGDWAQLSEPDGVQIYAQSPSGNWVSGIRTSAALLPEAYGDRSFHLAQSSTAELAARFETVEGVRSATACALVFGTGIAACVTRPAPLIGMGDLNRLVIYGLLLAAPLLAITGLLFANARLRKLVPPPEARARKGVARLDPATMRAFEAPGLVGVWRWDPAMQLITIGPEAAQLLGSYRSGEMTLDEFTALVSDDERRKVQMALEHADPLRQVELAFSSANRATPSYFEMMGAASDSGISGAILNVTDRIQAQHRSRRAEALARAALDAHPGPFAVWDSRRRLTHWNAAFVRMFNLDKSVAQVGASYDLVMSEVAKFVKIERPLGDDTNAREILLLSDLWIRLVDRKTASDGLITVGLDISKLKLQEASTARSERRLRAMVAELERTQGQAKELAARFAEQRAAAERASQAKSVFLANMSHELRTPLNAINGFSEMLVHQVYGPLGDARYKGYAEDILGAGQHLLDMINDILDMAKIEAGKFQISPKPIDPSDAVDAAIRLIRRRAADKGVAMQFDPDDDVPDINGDHRAIKQMTLNLLANAIKFTDAGGEIRVSITNDEHWVTISVADTGCGIPEADLPRLGQPFEQAASADGRNSQGTGLGLALTKSFAEMHGGYLSIDSELGKGTTVSINLPIPRTPAASSETSPQTGTIETGASQRSNS